MGEQKEARVFEKDNGGEMTREQAEELVINKLAAKYGTGIIGKEVTFSGGLEEEIFQYAVDEKMRSLLWTPEKPTKSGWYWYRHHSKEGCIVAVNDEGFVIGPGDDVPRVKVSDSVLDGGEWAGPLTPPEEEK